MDEKRFFELFHEGPEVKPTIQEYAGFVSIVEKLPAELLWKLANGSTLLHPILKSVLMKTLQEKIQRDKDADIDKALNAIVTRLVQP